MGNQFGRADEQALVILTAKSGRILQRPINTTLDVVRVPDLWLGRWVNLVAMGNDAYYLTSKTAPVGVTLADSAVDASTKVATLAGTQPFPLPQGAIIPVYFDSGEDLFIGVIGANAGGKWYGCPSSPNQAMER